MSVDGNMFGVIAALLLLANTLVNLWAGRKASQATVAIKDVHTIINSQLTAERAARNEQESKLVDATQRAARAEGLAEGAGISKKDQS